MMSAWPSMWLENNRICDVLQDLIVYLMFWYLSWCVPDSILVCMWHFSNRKINFYYALCSFAICLLSSFWYIYIYIYIYIYRASFYRLFTEHRTTLETSSPPATSVHQDDTLIYAFFVLETLNYFFCYWLMLAWEPATLY